MGVPVYVKIQQYIKSKISSGEWTEDMQIPTERNSAGSLDAAGLRLPLLCGSWCKMESFTVFREKELLFPNKPMRVNYITILNWHI